MRSVSDFLKQKDSFNISGFIFYILKRFYAFNKREMSYEKRVRRIIIMTMMMQKNSNCTFCDKYINNNNNNNNLWSNSVQEKYTCS